LFAGRLALFRLTQVRHDRRRPTAQCANVRGGFFKRWRITRGQHHIGPCIGQGQRHFAPQAAAPAGDEQTLAIQSKSIQHAHAGTCLARLRSFNVKFDA